MVWEKLQVEGIEHERINEDTINVLVKRWDHTLNVVLGGLLVYIFGGVDADSLITDEVLIFDTVSQKWRRPSMRGVPPEARSRHTATLIDETIFVFGGGNSTMGLYNDLHLLNTSTNTWTSPTVTGEVPAARRGHVAAAIGKQLFIHGGCGLLENWSSMVVYDDLYILDTETFVWRRAVTSGAIPTHLESHTCSAWGNKLVVVGGKNREREYFNDVHILDTDTLVWTRLNTWGQIMRPRAGHTAVAFGNNLFVFGGYLSGHTLYEDFYRIELDSGALTKLSDSGEGPSARHSLAGDILWSQPAGILVFFGGCNWMLEATEDMYYFYTGLQMEDQTQEKGSPRKKKSKHDDQDMFTSPFSSSIWNQVTGPNFWDF